MANEQVRDLLVQRRQDAMRKRDQFSNQKSERGYCRSGCVAVMLCVAATSERPTCDKCDDTGLVTMYTHPEYVAFGARYCSCQLGASMARCEEVIRQRENERRD